MAVVVDLFRPYVATIRHLNASKTQFLQGNEQLPLASTHMKQNPQNILQFGVSQLVRLQVVFRLQLGGWSDLQTSFPEVALLRENSSEWYHLPELNRNSKLSCTHKHSRREKLFSIREENRNLSGRRTGHKKRSLLQTSATFRQIKNLKHGVPNHDSRPCLHRISDSVVFALVAHCTFGS